MKSKARAQELFRSVRGDVSLLVVRPPPASPPGYEEDLDNLLDLPSSTLDTQVCDYLPSDGYQSYLGERDDHKDINLLVSVL